MNTLSIKRSAIEPLWAYEPKLNDWSHKTHELTREKCEAMLKVLKPIAETIKEEEKKVRQEQRWHYSTPEMIAKTESIKQLIKIFTALKSMPSVFTLDFNF